MFFEFRVILELCEISYARRMKTFNSKQLRCTVGFLKLNRSLALEKTQNNLIKFFQSYGHFQI